LYEISYSTLMPPMCFLIATPIGALIALRWRRTGLAIVLISALLLYGSCTQFVANRLLAAVEREVPPASAAALADAQAIAILSGDVYHGKPGGVPDDVGLLTLDRLRLAAALYRAHPLPILVTGAVEGNNAESSAALMARTLEQDYGIKPTWLEEQANNTFENGAYSAQILKANGIARVIVVTQAWHMPRALWSFAQAGITAIPAPAARTYPGSGLDRSDWQPDYASFAKTFFALHEIIGLAYYRWHYGSAKAPD
jgi:uncharacterized SAM-binding protein YcdF (DUF218 family)